MSPFLILSGVVTFWIVWAVLMSYDPWIAHMWMLSTFAGRLWYMGRRA